MLRTPTDLNPNYNAPGHAGQGRLLNNPTAPATSRLTSADPVHGALTLSETDRSNIYYEWISEFPVLVQFLVRILLMHLQGLENLTTSFVRNAGDRTSCCSARHAVDHTIQGVSHRAKSLHSQGSSIALHVGTRTGTVFPLNSQGGHHRTHPEARLLRAGIGADGIVLRGWPNPVVTYLQ